MPIWNSFNHHGSTMNLQLNVASLVIGVFCIAVTNSSSANDDPVADFSLLDVNTTSSTYDQMVSPSDYLESATGWYFGHAT